jgi:hypothetical protein
LGPFVFSKYQGTAYPRDGEWKKVWVAYPEKDNVEKAMTKVSVYKPPDYT